MRISDIWAGTTPISISDMPQSNGQCPKRLSTSTIKWHHSPKTNNSSLVTKVKSPFCITNPRFIKTT